MERPRATLVMLGVLRAARQELAEKFIEEDPTLFRDLLRSRKGHLLAPFYVRPLAGCYCLPKDSSFDA